MRVRERRNGKMADEEKKEEVKQEPAQLYDTGYIDRYQQSQAALDKHLSTKPGDYQSKYQPSIDKAMAAIAERKPFQYNVNGDALYQQYKDRYGAMGKQAMKDTMGKAAAMTGGYGSTYAQQVGQQTYDQYMTSLMDKIPELYQLALAKYEREAQADKEKYSLYRDADNTDYGRWADQMNLWSSDRAYLAGRADTELGQAMTVAQALEARLAALAAKGYTPTADELRAIGYTPAQWALLHPVSVSGGGGGGGGGGGRELTGIPALDYGVGGGSGGGKNYINAGPSQSAIDAAASAMKDSGYSDSAVKDYLTNNGYSGSTVNNFYDRW